MKHNYNDYTVPAGRMHVDSMQNLKDVGYRRHGLDVLCADLKIETMLKYNEIRGNATESIRIHAYRHNILLERKVTYTTAEGVWPG